MLCCAYNLLLRFIFPSACLFRNIQSSNNQLLTTNTHAGEKKLTRLLELVYRRCTPIEGMAITSAPIPPYKFAFIQSCVSASVPNFGNYTLKSSRISPCFFNAGLFHTGDLILSISTAFARLIHDYQSSHLGFEFDVLFALPTRVFLWLLQPCMH